MHLVALMTQREKIIFMTAVTVVLTKTVTWEKNDKWLWLHKERSGNENTDEAPPQVSTCTVESSSDLNMLQISATFISELWSWIFHTLLFSRNDGLSPREGAVLPQKDLRPKRMKPVPWNLCRTEVRHEYLRPSTVCTALKFVQLDGKLNTTA